MKKTLYVRRQVLNAGAIIAWAKDQGFRTALPPAEMHVTMAYSKDPVEWDSITPIASDYLIRSRLKTEPRSVEKFGDGAIVLRFEDADLEARWAAIREAGAVWKHPEFAPHITISYDPGNLDPSVVEPYGGRIQLGPEIFEEVQDDWSDALVEKSDVEFRMRLVKVDDERGQGFGIFSVADVHGSLVVDGEDDTISADELEKAAYDHVLEWRLADENHDGTEKARLIESMLFTPEKCAALQKELRDSGIPATIYIPATVWWGGHQIDDMGVRAKVKSGEYTGFSIGGTAVRTRRAA